MNRTSNYVAIMILAFAVTLSLPNSVFAQTSPWGLFQRLCQSGGLATGPQCQNFQTQQQPGAATSSSSTCSNAFTTLCSPNTATGSTNTLSGTCTSGYTLQGSVCVPTSTSSLGTTGTCPTNYTLQNGLCVPTSTSSSSSVGTTGTCPTNYILQNGVCVP